MAIGDMWPRVAPLKYQLYVYNLLQAFYHLRCTTLWRDRSVCIIIIIIIIIIVIIIIICDVQ